VIARRRVANSLAGAFLLFASAAGCKTAGEYVWADSLSAPTKAGTSEYVIQPGDTIAIRVWNQDSVTTKAKVRSDGKISLPFVNDVEAAGSTPNALAARVQTTLKDFIVNPVVTVTLEEARPATVAVIGEVVRAGKYPLDPGAGVLEALAMASGMTLFADKDRIMVIRQKPDGSGAMRIRFTYSSLTQLEGRAATFRLQGGDVVVVE
jgi:polysaccharide export outer membrane protein